MLKESIKALYQKHVQEDIVSHLNLFSLHFLEVLHYFISFISGFFTNNDGNDVFSPSLVTAQWAGTLGMDILIRTVTLYVI
jgi:hypothetical protein